MIKPVRGEVKLPATEVDRILIKPHGSGVLITYQEFIDGMWRDSDGSVLLPPGFDVYRVEDTHINAVTTSVYKKETTEAT